MLWLLTALLLVLFIRSQSLRRYVLATVGGAFRALGEATDFRIVLLLIALASMCWWGLVGQRDDDIVALMASLFVAQAVGWYRSWTALKVVTATLVSAWLMVSAIDRYSPHVSRPTQNRFRHARQRWPHLRVGVALSGGGYRAALFHAGVLRGLEEQGVPITVLSTVSGGSIIGAYYAAGGSPDDFVKLVAQGRLNLKRQMVNPWTLFALMGESLSRTNVQATLLDQALLGEVPFAKLRRRNGRGVDIVMATTDLQRGMMIGLVPSGLVGVGPDTRPVYLEARGEFPRTAVASEIVATSGAFPGAFPPTPWSFNVRPLIPADFAPGNDASDNQTVGAPWGARRQLSLLLADGGVTDNTGVLALAAIQEMMQPETYGPSRPRQNRGHLHMMYPSRWRAPGWEVDCVIISDASAATLTQEQFGSLSSIRRVGDIVGAFQAAALDASILRKPGSQCVPYHVPGLGDTVLCDNTRRLRIGSREVPVITVSPADIAESVDLSQVLSVFPFDLEPLGTPRRLSADFMQTLGKVAAERGTSQHEVETMRASLQKIWTGWLAIFDRSSTLEDQYSGEAASALGDFGRALTQYSSRAIENALDNAAVNSCPQEPLARSYSCSWPGPSHSAH